MSRSVLKKWLGFALQVAVTGGLLWWILHNPEKRGQMVAALRHADWRWLAGGLALYGGVEFLAVTRWKTLLHIQNFRIGWRQATGILFIGEFFLTFTPGLVGGDVARVYYLVREQPDKKVDAFTAVLMDRVMGLLSLIVLAAVMLTTRYSWLRSAPSGAELTQVVALILGGAVVAVIASLVIAGMGILDRPRVPAALRDLGTALGHFKGDRPRTLLAFGSTLLSHLCYYGAFCFAAGALHDVAPPVPSMGDVFSIMPIENTLTAMPVSFAGIGLRESLFQTLLHDLAGVDAGVGALIGSLGFLMKAVWALPGAVVFLVRGGMRDEG